ncbi:MAG: glycolate oxidase subunit GlcF [Chromatiaceae bacterium]|nr:glycolate oxidase subunit GlcF [Chromatiaceae bacterium]
MQTQLADFIRDSHQGQEADAILRSCVHCGFCTATCPTYQLLGDELDGPRGRIYLIKQVLEGQTPSRKTQIHLDRCLTCRSCETTCPSGVRYGRLVEIGRAAVEAAVPRPWDERLARRLLRWLVPSRVRFGLFLGLGQLFRPLLPASLKAKVPLRRVAGPWPTAPRPRTLLALAGCAQAAATPDTNAAAARVLDRLGIRLVEAPRAGCCGALPHHLGAEEEALAMIRRNIDAWWPQVEAGAEAILVTASGCGAMVKDYGALLAQDPVYAAKAARIASLARDPSEVLAVELARPEVALPMPGAGRKIAFHSPCSLQHGQKLPGLAEGLLTRLGYELTPVADGHLCCGSAGSYSLLQPTLARQLRDNKLNSLAAGGPECIATANVGCQLHLESGTRIPVRHWIELVDEVLAAGPAAPT